MVGSEVFLHESKSNSSFGSSIIDVGNDSYTSEVKDSNTNSHVIADEGTDDSSHSHSALLTQALQPSPPASEKEQQEEDREYAGEPMNSNVSSWSRE